MIIDVTGTSLTPGNLGKDCLGNGDHLNESAELIECCCDECDYLLCCIDENYMQECIDYSDVNYPRNKTNTVNHP